MQVRVQQMALAVQVPRVQTALQNNRARLLVVVVVLMHEMPVTVRLWQLQGLCLQWWLLL
jgi:hypothetical protein